MTCRRVLIRDRISVLILWWPVIHTNVTFLCCVVYLTQYCSNFWVRELTRLTEEHFYLNFFFYKSIILLDCWTRKFHFRSLSNSSLTCWANWVCCWTSSRALLLGSSAVNWRLTFFVRSVTNEKKVLYQLCVFSSSDTHKHWIMKVMNSLVHLLLLVFCFNIR